MGTGQLQPYPPISFKKMKIFIALEVYTYVCSDYMLNFTSNFNSVTKDTWFFCAVAILKVNLLKWLLLSWLLNLAQPTIILVGRKILKLVCAMFLTDVNIYWTLCKLWHFGLE